MQQCMAGAVSRRAGTGSLLAAVIHGLPAEWALVDAAIVEPRERQPHMLEFDYRLGGMAAHELDGVLIAQIIRTFHRVIHVPVPVVRRDIAQCGGNAALGRYRVRTRREYLGHHRHLQARNRTTARRRAALRRHRQR